LLSLTLLAALASPDAHAACAASPEITTACLYEEILELREQVFDVAAEQREVKRTVDYLGAQYGALRVAQSRTDDSLERHDRAVGDLVQKTDVTLGRITGLDAEMESVWASLTDAIDALTPPEELEGLADYLRVNPEYDAIVIEGANLFVRSGEGVTEAAPNGLGNVIIGYGEGGERTGSHNLVVGHGHSFTSHSGIIAGVDNDVRAPYAVIGGAENLIEGEASFAVGARNTAAGAASSVSGGTDKGVQEDGGHAY